MQRCLAAVLFLLVLAGCNAGGAGGVDVGDRLLSYQESGCGDPAGFDNRHTSVGNSGRCGGFAAGQRDLYIDWVRGTR